MRQRPTAIILAAGSGSRLLPQTAHTPKCLTEIAGQPILRYQLAALRACGITDIVIVVGYLSHKIRESVDDSVVCVENCEYASTNSSYSLWVARHYLKDGFIHLNSDLLFEPQLLTALLAHPAENAVIVDRHVAPESDMMKAEMNGNRILQMAKQLTSGATAEVVGPAKFSPAGARRLIERLERLVASGERQRWAYSVFGELAESLEFTGIDNPGCFWAEVDTVADAKAADRGVPPSLVALARSDQSWLGGCEDAPSERIQSRTAVG